MDARILNFPDGPAASPRGDPRDEASTAFHLGLLHLTARGLDIGWLLRAAAHAHWGAILRGAGVRPGGLRDLTGACVIPALVQCNVAGEAAAFHEDMPVTLEMVTAPTPGTGYFSAHVLAGDGGAAMVVELVTAFAKRAGPSNRDLVAAQMTPDMQSTRDRAAGARARRLRDGARAARMRAAADPRPPHTSVTMVPGVHFNGAGLLDAARLSEIVEAAEIGALPPLTAAWPVEAREMSVCANIDGGDRLDLVTDFAAAGSWRVVARTVARRRADGAPVAISETWRRQRGEAEASSPATI